MSSNTSKGRGEKGSKFWIQEIINSGMKIDLEKQIGLGEINWISPLAKDNYTEYKLNQSNIIELIGIAKESYKFWPDNQPQWDAIGMTEDTIILVEAKAHLKELNSYQSATSEESKKLIRKTMQNVFDENYSDGNFEKWIKGHYQLGNRLAFLKKMKELASENGMEVKLVLLNIVNDLTHIPTTEEEWENKYNDVLIEMTGLTPPLKDVIMVNFKV